jgi:glycerol-3-phosphate dehydrogenase
MKKFHVVVIGGGSSGAAIAYDLALRGIRVTLLERGGIAGGTTGHNQAQLHSGARYAIRDPESARECIADNRVLRKIMVDGLELNDGLFIALNEEHLAYLPLFLEGCARCGIPTREISIVEALRLEPNLNPNILAAIQVPDGVFDPYRFTLSFVASAIKKGAKVSPFNEVVGLDVQHGRVKVLNRSKRIEENIECDAIINAAGPWAKEIAALADVHIDLEASAGVMVTIRKRICNTVINLLAPPGDSDIIVPQRQTSILGTTSWMVEDADKISIPPDHIVEILKMADWLIPDASKEPVHGVMAAARPLIKKGGESGRDATRSFACFDHAGEGKQGFFSIIGGKTTTARLMAEKMVDMVCARLGVDAECQTSTVALCSYRLGL